MSVVLLLLACASSVRDRTVGDADVVTVRIAYNNAHVVEAGGLRVLVDAGLEEDAVALGDALIDEGVDPAELDALFVTHAHADHAGGAGYLQSTYGVPVVLGAGDAGMLADGGSDDALCPTNARAERRVETDGGATYAPFVPDILAPMDGPSDLGTLLGGDPAGITLEPVPGHTDGSMVMRAGDGLFVGDLLRGTITGRGAAVHFYMCDLDDNQADIEQLLAAHPTVGTVFPGHFGPIDRQKVERVFSGE